MHEETQPSQKSMWVCAVLLTGNDHVLWQLWFQRPEARYLSFLPSLLSHSAALLWLDDMNICTLTFSTVCVCVTVCQYGSTCANPAVILFFFFFCKYIFTNVLSYQPQSKLSRGPNAAPSSPPYSGSAAGWFPPPLWASSLWTRPPPPAAIRRLQTPWTGWSTHGCCTNSSGGQSKRARGDGGGSKLQTKISVNLEGSGRGGHWRWGNTETDTWRPHMGTYANSYWLPCCLVLLLLKMS